jgi:hypothetical protein
MRGRVPQGQSDEEDRKAKLTVSITAQGMKNPKSVRNLIIGLLMIMPLAPAVIYPNSLWAAIVTILGAVFAFVPFEKLK